MISIESLAFTVKNPCHTFLSIALDAYNTNTYKVYL